MKFLLANSNSAESGVILVVMIILLVMLCACIAGTWKMYEKMGEPGWACLIPIYSSWLMYKHAMGKGVWMLASFIPYVGSVVALICIWKWYKCFGKSTLFCIFGLLFSPIAMLICAFDDSTFSSNYY